MTHDLHHSCHAYLVNHVILQEQNPVPEYLNNSISMVASVYRVQPFEPRSPSAAPPAPRKRFESIRANRRIFERFIFTKSVPCSQFYFKIRKVSTLAAHNQEILRDKRVILIVPVRLCYESVSNTISDPRSVHCHRLARSSESRPRIDLPTLLIFERGKDNTSGATDRGMGIGIRIQDTCSA